MGLSSAMQWWEEWQLRILVLGSCFIQYVLFLSVWIRTAAILHRLRVLVWIAYIGGDAVAIYALATLFNRRQQTWDGESSTLEVLWVPVLLIHLGGQPMISAYSLEDNELLKRHTVTLVSQVAVALYVFCKWWSGEKTLLVVAILLFVLGIIKFAQKPWALRIASFDIMQTSSLLPRAFVERVLSLDEYVQEAKELVLEAKVDSLYEFEYGYVTQSYYMFVDLAASYSFQISRLSAFLLLQDKNAYNALQNCLGYTFGALYTRAASVTTIFGFGLTLLLPFLALASTLIFATSKKDGHNDKDLRVTYILFGCTTMLEFLLPCMIFCLGIPCCRTLVDNAGWHKMVSQENIVSYCVRKKKPTFLMKLAPFKFIQELINQHWYIQHVPIAFQITRLVRQHVEYGWKKYIHDAANYRRFSELRGQWAIRRHHQLGWILKKPFGESVVIWHIATDLCFHHPSTSPQRRQGEATKRSREISNYMIYLLLTRPEMLMPGTRSDLFTLASNQILKYSRGPLDQILKYSKGPLDLTEEILAHEIINIPILPSKDDTICNARKLTEALMELDNEEQRWNLIQGVWVDMLCYSASRCRGYLHANSLGGGGECLTTIWLLLSFMGMETLADRHQRSEPPQEEEGEGQEQGGEGEESCTSRAQGRASQSADDYSPV